MRDRADLVGAAARAGLTITQIEELPDGSIASRMTFEDPWAAARLLAELTDQDADDPVVRMWSYEILAATADAIGESDYGPTLSPALLGAFVRALHWNVVHQIKFRHEPVETFQSARLTMRLLAGDCDDHARLLVALARSAGVEAELVFFDDGEQPVHGVALLRDSDSWWWAETTVDAIFGEPPLDAVARLRASGIDLGRDPFAQDDATQGIGTVFGLQTYAELADLVAVQAWNLTQLDSVKACPAWAARDPQGYGAWAADVFDAEATLRAALDDADAAIALVPASIRSATPVTSPLFTENAWDRVIAAAQPFHALTATFGAQSGCAWPSGSPPQPTAPDLDLKVYQWTGKALAATATAWTGVQVIAVSAAVVAAALAVREIARSARP